MSLIIEAPLSRTHRATSALYVSTEIGSDTLEAKRVTTGNKRLNSSLAVNGVAPGLVDSPPISMMSAPSDSSCKAPASARSGSRWIPPSANESGVTFKMPMTRVRSPSLRTLPLGSRSEYSRLLEIIDELRIHPDYRLDGRMKRGFRSVDLKLPLRYSFIE